MRYQMFVIYGHPVIAATRALHFTNHVTKRNSSGDENDLGRIAKTAICHNITQ